MASSSLKKQFSFNMQITLCEWQRD